MNLTWFLYEIGKPRSDLDAWPSKYKHGIVYARNLEISCNYFGSVTNVLPYGSTHQASPLPRVLEAAYSEDIVKPVHKPTNPSKYCTQKHKLAGLTEIKTKWWLSVWRVAILTPALPKMRACGLPPTEKWAVQSVCNCWKFGGVRSQLRRPPSKSHACVVIVPTIIDNYSSACSSSRKIREKDATCSRKNVLDTKYIHNPHTFTESGNLKISLSFKSILCLQQLWSRCDVIFLAQKEL